jgi:hypothetical protein
MNREGLFYAKHLRDATLYNTLDFISSIRKFCYRGGPISGSQGLKRLWRSMQYGVWSISNVTASKASQPEDVLMKCYSTVKT